MNGSQASSTQEISTAKLETLYEFANALASAQDITEALDILLLSLMGITRTSSSAFFTQQDDGLYRLAVSRGGGDKFCKKEIVDVPEEILSASYFLHDQAGFSDSGLDSGTCRLCVPVSRKDTPLGIICLGSKAFDEPYGEEEIRFIQSLAKLAAMLIENSRFIEKLKDL
ncbi:GAF domain-containing protein, partial [Acidobacteriota bacterium]